MTRLTVILPYPAYSLSPNGRSHWRKVAAMREEAKFDGANCARVALDGQPSPFAPTDTLRAWVTFCPPTKRRRDLDNVFSGTKAYMDGVCDALGVDDSRIEQALLQWGEVVKGGEVVVTLAK